MTINFDSLPSEEVHIDTLVFHDVSARTPRMSQDKFSSFVNQIEVEGQLDAALVYRNKIVDGRHRYLALKKLGNPIIKIKRLPNNLTVENLKEIVFSKELRRHSTASQMAIMAWYEYMEDTRANTMDTMAKKHGIGLNQIKRANKIGGEKKNHYKRPDILDIIYNGGKINIGTSTNPILTDSLSTIENWLGKARANEKDDITGIKASRGLTDEEDQLVNQIINRIEKESEYMKEALVKRLYTEINKIKE